MSDEQLAQGWSIAWRAAMVTSASLLALCLALRWFLGAPASVLLVTAAVGGLSVGRKLPAARPAFARR